MPALPILSHASLPCRLQWALAAVLSAALLWAALAPLHYPTRERLLEFPHGAAVLRGQAGPVLVPAELRLTLGVRDELFGLALDRIERIQASVRLSPLPESMTYFDGLADVGDAVVPVIDLDQIGRAHV